MYGVGLAVRLKAAESKTRAVRGEALTASIPNGRCKPSELRAWNEYYEKLPYPVDGGPRSFAEWVRGVLCREAKLPVVLQDAAEGPGDSKSLASAIASDIGS